MIWLNRQSDCIHAGYQNFEALERTPRAQADCNLMACLTNNDRYQKSMLQSWQSRCLSQCPQLQRSEGKIEGAPVQLGRSCCTSVLRVKTMQQALPTCSGVRRAKAFPLPWSTDNIDVKRKASTSMRGSVITARTADSRPVNDAKPPFRSGRHHKANDQTIEPQGLSQLQRKAMPICERKFF